MRSNHLLHLGNIKVQLAKLTRVKDKDERTTKEKRIETIKRFAGWVVWILMTGSVLYGIWRLGYVSKKDIYASNCLYIILRIIPIYALVEFLFQRGKTRTL